MQQNTFSGTQRSSDPIADFDPMSEKRKISLDHIFLTFPDECFGVVRTETVHHGENSSIIIQLTPTGGNRFRDADPLLSSDICETFRLEKSHRSNRYHRENCPAMIRRRSRQFVLIIFMFSCDILIDCAISFLFLPSSVFPGREQSI
jgi:hypothetical protein